LLRPPEPVRNLIAVTRLRQIANRLGLTDVNLLGIQAKLSGVVLEDAGLVALSHHYPSAKYLKSASVLSMTIPQNSEGEPIRDQEVIDWVEVLFERLAKVYGEASKSDSNSTPT
jgi:transcription-repair coupling factor (superfamily II helicase)